MKTSNMTGTHCQIDLITYPNSLGHTIPALHSLLNSTFREAVGGVHLLPFYPSSGDRGFAPVDYRRVDEAFGTWADIRNLSEDYALMADFMINHISAESAYYRDFLDNKEASPYRSMFIQYKDFWQNGEPTETETALIYKRKPKAPFTTARFSDGSEEKVWCTFGEEQIDLDIRSDVTRSFIQNTLGFLAQANLTRIRLDAFAYAVKKAGTSCFFIEPEIWELLKFCADVLSPYGARVLPEIHEHYSLQLKLAEKGYDVYDFALPMLLLNAIYFGKTEYLKHWLQICPRNQYTTLDTHDGIGAVDVADLLPDDELARTREAIYQYGANVKKIYSTDRYNNLDVYQINCTYYSALGDNDDAYLLARAVQFFAPGIPQVYYVGLLAGKNDVALLERTKEGRDINRHVYSLPEITREVRRPVVQKLLQLMAFRNTHPSFQGAFELIACAQDALRIRRSNGSDTAELYADFQNNRFLIRYSAPGGMRELSL